MRRSNASLLVLLALSALLLLAVSAGEETPRIDRSRVKECSGLVQSHKTPGIYWTLSDSGNPASLFAVRAGGEIVREVRVEGATNVDWEDITTDDAGNLYIADTGNNENARRDLVVYRLREPHPTSEVEAVPVERRLRLRYAEQRAFPDPAAKNFDAEALFWARGRLYLLTKHRSDTRTVLYRFPEKAGGEEVALERVGTFDVGGGGQPFGGMVTSAAATRDGSHLAVLTYHALFLFERPEDSDAYLSRPIHRIDFDQRVTKQCEALAWDGTSVIVANEDGRLHRIESPLDRRVKRYPAPAGDGSE